VNHGNIAFSFTTDTKGSNLESGFKAIKKLVPIANKFVDGAEVRTIPANPVGSLQTNKKARRGKAETSLIIQKVEELLLPDYFSKPKSTGDVRSELHSRTGISFQSRKVSQALGALALRGKLGRTGSKEKQDFRYFNP